MEQQEKKGTPITLEDIQKLQLPVASHEEKLIGLDKFHSDMQAQGRVVLPYLKLVQSMSDDFTKDKIMPGHFRNSLTGEDLGETVEICPIGILHWRRFFEERRVSCASNDAIIGYGDPGGDCNICPLQKWHVIRVNGKEEAINNAQTFRAKKDEQMVPPICSEQYVFPCMILNSEWGIPGALVFHKSYLQIGLRFYSMAYFAPEDTVYRLTSIQTTNEKGTWYVPKITTLRKLDEKEREQRSKYKTNMRNAVVDIEVPDEEDPLD